MVSNSNPAIELLRLIGDPNLWPGSPEKLAQSRRGPGGIDADKVRNIVSPCLSDDHLWRGPYCGGTRTPGPLSFRPTRGEFLAFTIKDPGRLRSPQRRAVLLRRVEIRGERNSAMPLPSGISVCSPATRGPPWSIITGLPAAAPVPP